MIKASELISLRQKNVGAFLESIERKVLHSNELGKLSIDVAWEQLKNSDESVKGQVIDELRKLGYTVKREMGSSYRAGDENWDYLIVGWK
jgi:hypothetical protein